MKEGIGALAENTDPFQYISTRLVEWIHFFFLSYKTVDPSTFDSRFYEIWGFSVM